MIPCADDRRWFARQCEYWFTAEGYVVTCFWRGDLEAFRLCIRRGDLARSLLISGTAVLLYRPGITALARALVRSATEEVRAYERGDNLPYAEPSGNWQD